MLSENAWTPEIVAKRQKTLIDKFKECWELDFVDSLEKNIAQDDDASNFYILNKRGANATGYSDDNGFVVKANSKVSDEVVEKFEISYPNAYKLREQLCNDGTIVNGTFQVDYEFDSVSLAASLVLGRNARGQKEWVDANGIAYDEK